MPPGSTAGYISSPRSIRGQALKHFRYFLASSLLINDKSSASDGVPITWNIFPS